MLPSVIQVTGFYYIIRGIEKLLIRDVISIFMVFITRKQTI